jgi:hypothetical protein
LHRMGRAPSRLDLCGGGDSRIDIDIAQHNPGSFAGEPSGARPANATCATGDYGDLVVQLIISHICSSSRRTAWQVRLRSAILTGLHVVPEERYSFATCVLYRRLYVALEALVELLNENLADN